MLCVENVDDQRWNAEIHKNGVPWTSRRLNLPVTRLVVQQPFQPNRQIKPQRSSLRTYYEENHQWPVDFHPKGPVMWMKRIKNNRNQPKTPRYMMKIVLVFCLFVCLFVCLFFVVGVTTAQSFTWVGLNRCIYVKSFGEIVIMAHIAFAIAIDITSGCSC